MHLVDGEEREGEGEGGIFIEKNYKPSSAVPLSTWQSKDWSDIPPLRNAREIQKAAALHKSRRSYFQPISEIH